MLVCSLLPLFLNWCYKARSGCWSKGILKLGEQRGNVTLLLLIVKGIRERSQHRRRRCPGVHLAVHGIAVEAWPLLGLQTDVFVCSDLSDGGIVQADE